MQFFWRLQAVLLVAVGAARAEASPSGWYQDNGAVVRIESTSTTIGDRRRVHLVDASKSSRARWIADREVLVKLAANIEPREAWRALGVRPVRALMEDARLWVVASDTEDAVALTTRLQSRSELVMAAPDLYLPIRTHSITLPPDDPRYPGQWYLETIRAESAWALSSGHPDVAVAVVDTGCDVDHPDLAANLLPGRDVVDDDDDPTFTPGTSSSHHGTAVAGLVAAVANNGEGIVGVCPECRMRCVRLFAERGALTRSSQIVAAFEFARTTGAAVVVNSWGFGDGESTPRAVADAIETLSTEGRGGLGAVVVFAAGNENRTIEPQELQAQPNVVAVGSTNNFDESSPFSNNGPAVDIVAPTGTLTTDPTGAAGVSDDGYSNTFGGSSSAAPIVAGVVALMAAANPTATAAELTDALLSSARPAPFATPDADGHDVLYGYGIVDARAALLAITGRTEPRDGGVAAAPDAGVSPVDAGASEPVESDGCRCVEPDSNRIFSLALFVVAAAIGARRQRGR